MGGFCPGGFCPGDFVLGGILSRGILSRGFLSGGFCPGGFCPRTEEINRTRAPFGPKTRLISWDIKNYYPSCDTEMCIKAVEKVVAQYPEHVLEVPLECIFEALRITMSTITGKFGTIGGPESASVTDIFGAVYIDPKAIQD